ncbi:MAG TPA: aminoacyl-tRNA hydrolase [Dissulfurispiraceae bacterium]|nr:aminoacyl-tRNA hydrolase [Dissulfurispiraceae bacterium]
MVLIAGLGNPGERYRATRHNVGFRVIDHIAGTLQIALQVKEKYSIGQGAQEGQRVTLLKPLTFMNLSGQAVRQVLRRYLSSADEPGSRLIVIHDDIDLPVGRIRIRRNGSSGGHRGIESIIAELGTREFVRIKIGVGREPLLPAEEFVLRAFRPDEKPLIDEAVVHAAEAVGTILRLGVEKAMTNVNRQKAGGENE